MKERRCKHADLLTVQSLSRKYIQALQASEVAEEGYRNLTANADQSLITRWIVQAEEAQTRCFADVTAMDIFDVQLQRGKREPLGGES